LRRLFLAKNASYELVDLVVRGESRSSARIHMLDPPNQVPPTRIRIEAEPNDEDAFVGQQINHVRIVAEAR
jgi:hypothetical protein